ncbi:unnamed protein product [marine sediment metagenome]|uniref:Uncharacterized protein n=1 Tax=marine sediment metagenome TaxID=412755 RepID=X1KR98_9ZZZZ
MTKSNPRDIARTVAKTAAITEKQPFTPQAQGTREGALEKTLTSPKGKGIPIKKARGAIKRRESNIFTVSEQAINRLKISSR